MGVEALGDERRHGAQSEDSHGPTRRVGHASAHQHFATLDTEGGGVAQEVAPTSHLDLQSGTLA